MYTYYKGVKQFVSAYVGKLPKEGALEGTKRLKFGKGGYLNTASVTRVIPASSEVMTRTSLFFLVTLMKKYVISMVSNKDNALTFGTFGILTKHVTFELNK